MTNSSVAANGFDPRYVEARRVLLDALFALEPHGSAIIIAGAQAIYLRTGDSNLSIAPYTTDGDLAINSSLLGDNPTLEKAMEQAGFVLMTQPGGHVEPGMWVTAVQIDGQTELVPIDLIVPEGTAEKRGRRGARLGSHGNRAARRISGLEAVLVDHSPMTVSDLDPAHPRSIEVEVAGVAGLLVAKANKLHDRLSDGNPRRIDDKDASDVLRIMQTNSPTQVGQTMADLVNDEIAGQPTIRALGFLDELFGRRGREGIEMASRALRLALDADTVEVICTTFVARMRAEMGRSA